MKIATLRLAAWCLLTQLQFWEKWRMWSKNCWRMSQSLLLNPKEGSLKCVCAVLVRLKNEKWKMNTKDEMIERMKKLCTSLIDSSRLLCGNLSHSFSFETTHIWSAFCLIWLTPFFTCVRSSTSSYDLDFGALWSTNFLFLCPFIYFYVFILIFYFFSFL